MPSPIHPRWIAVATKKTTPTRIATPPHPGEELPAKELLEVDRCPFAPDWSGCRRAWRRGRKGERPGGAGGLGDTERRVRLGDRRKTEERGLDRGQAGLDVLKRDSGVSSSYLMFAI